jgi:hypothetical protein
LLPVLCHNAGYVCREGSDELDREILEKLDQLREETNCERR